MTQAENRILTLDIIRGIAVMGIFSVNVVAFAMIEGAYFNPAAYGGHTGIDLFVWAANMVVVDGKLRTLFSMLFGASMLLVAERAEAAGFSQWSMHLRRMAVLFVIGLAHYFFLWWGDILHHYAIIGVIAFAFRNRAPEGILAWAIIFLGLDMLLMGGSTFAMYQMDIAAHAPNASPAAIAAWNGFAAEFSPTAAMIAKEQEIFGGSYGTRLTEMISNRAGDPIFLTLIFAPETLSLMLFGMWGYKSGFLTGAWDDASYRRIATVAIPIGALAFAAIVAVDIVSGFYLPYVFGGFSVASAPFRPIMAFGYAALIMLLCRNPRWLAQRLAAVGRTAFTNYLGTSVIAAFAFYGWGLGLYGQVSRAEAWLLVPLVWLLMLAWSKPWLNHYRYGPLEWLWRSLARGQLQPMRKAVAA